MIYLELPPPPRLDQLVRCFWFLRSDTAMGVPQPVVADGRIEIVLHAAEPFARVDDAGQLSLQGEALLAGQLTGPIHLQQQGPADVVGIRFRTGAASALIGAPLEALTDRVEPLASLAPSLRDQLLRAVASASDPYGRRDALSLVLLKALRTAPDPMVMSAIRTLDCPSPPDLARLARSFGISTRTLERRIVRATGLAPRSLLRTMRFRRVFQGLQGAAGGTMTGIAVGSGYFDQAHCIREFRRFTGRSPSDFFSEDPALAIALSGDAG